MRLSMPCQRAASTIAANKWRNPVKSLKLSNDRRLISLLAGTTVARASDNAGYE